MVKYPTIARGWGGWGGTLIGALVVTMSLPNPPPRWAFGFQYKIFLPQSVGGGGSGIDRCITWNYNNYICIIISARNKYV